MATMKRAVTKIDTIAKLAVLVQKNIRLNENLARSMAEDFADVQERLDTVDERLDLLQSDVRNGFQEMQKKYDDADTRISGLEYRVFNFNGSLKSVKKI